MTEDPNVRKCFEAEWAAGRLTRPRDANIRLRKYPEAFLRTYPPVNPSIATHMA